MDEIDIRIPESEVPVTVDEEAQRKLENRRIQTLLSEDPNMTYPNMTYDEAVTHTKANLRHAH